MLSIINYKVTIDSSYEFHMIKRNHFKHFQLYFHTWYINSEQYITIHQNILPHIISTTTPKHTHTVYPCRIANQFYHIKSTSTLQLITSPLTYCRSSCCYRAHAPIGRQRRALRGRRLAWKNIGSSWSEAYRASEEGIEWACSNNAWGVSVIRDNGKSKTRRQLANNGMNRTVLWTTARDTAICFRAHQSRWNFNQARLTKWKIELGLSHQMNSNLQFCIAHTGTLLDLTILRGPSRFFD